MKIILLMSLFLAISCSKSGGGGSSPGEVISYNAEYEYPENDLEPGDGVRQVQASAIKHCFDNKGNNADHSKCKPIEQAPQVLQQSPAGQVAISVAGAVGGEVMITVSVGENVSSLAQIIIDIRIAANLNCSPGYTQVNAQCKIPGYELVFSPYSTPTKTTACTGSEFLIRTVTDCINNITLASVDPTNCTGLVDSAQSVNYASPAGTRQVVNGSNTETYTCAAGELGGTLSNIVCGNPLEHKSGLTCVADIIVPSYSYPADSTEICGGPLTVNADAVTSCFNVTKNSTIPNSNCPMPAIPPTVTYQSQAGTKNVTNGVNTEVYTCAADEVGGTMTDIVCGDANQHKNGLVCEADEFLASNFTYPVNSLTAGYGSQVVSPSGFTTCTNTTKSQSADLSLCTIPAGAPTETFLAPAGDVDFTIANSVGGKVTLSFTEGEDFYGLSNAVKDARIAAGLTCLPTFLKDSASCKNVVKFLSPSLGQINCVIMSDDSTRCWGDGSTGQFGDGTTNKYVTATDIPNYNGAKAIYVGGSHSCAIMIDDSVKCSGDNSTGQLGNGTTTSTLTAITIPSWAGAKSMYLGGAFTCAQWPDLSVKCSGSNARYQLGDNTTVDKSTPITIAGWAGAKQLSAGSFEICGISIADSVKCTGWNNIGQMGTGNSTSLRFPTTVNGWGSGNLKQVSVGGNKICAVRIDGTVLCSGINGSNNLGDGTTVNKTTPVVVTGLINVKSLFSHNASCAILNDDTVKCFGANYNGDIGNGTTTNIGLAVSIPVYDGAESFVMNSSSTCSINGTTKALICTGGNFTGQLGDGTSVGKTTPILVINAQPE